MQKLCIVPLTKKKKKKKKYFVYYPTIIFSYFAGNTKKIAKLFLSGIFNTVSLLNVILLFLNNVA